MISALHEGLRRLTGITTPVWENAKAVRKYLSECFQYGPSATRLFRLFCDAGRGKAVFSLQQLEASCNLGVLEAALLALRYNVNIFVADPVFLGGVPFNVCDSLLTHDGLDPQLQTKLERISGGGHGRVLLIHDNEHFVLPTKG